MKRNRRTSREEETKQRRRAGPQRPKKHFMLFHATRSKYSQETAMCISHSLSSKEIKRFERKHVSAYVIISCTPTNKGNRKITIHPHPPDRTKRSCESRKAQESLSAHGKITSSIDHETVQRQRKRDVPRCHDAPKQSGFRRRACRRCG